MCACVGEWLYVLYVPLECGIARGICHELQISSSLSVTILLRNDRNKGHEVFSHFAVDKLTDVISLFSSPMNCTQDQAAP